MKLAVLLALSVSFATIQLSQCNTARASDPLRLVDAIPLAGVDGRIDHLAIDVDNNQLFVAALGDNTVQVVDLVEKSVVAQIKSLMEPQGIAFLKDQHLLAVACADDGICKLFAERSLSPIKSFDFQTDADNLRFDSDKQRLYVGYGDALGEIDVPNRQRLASIALSGHPESFQLETRSSRAFVNIPTSRRIAVIDRTSSSVIATWAVNAEANFPMALDEQSRRLFIGCRHPSAVLVYDIDSGKEVSRFPTVGDCDDMFYDARNRRLYVSGGEGYVAVHERMDADQFTLLAKVPTAVGARTSYFEPSQSRLFVAVPHSGSQRAEIRIYEAL